MVKVITIEEFFSDLDLCRLALNVIIAKYLRELR